MGVAAGSRRATSPCASAARATPTVSAAARASSIRWSWSAPTTPTVGDARQEGGGEERPGVAEEQAAEVAEELRLPGQAVVGDDVGEELASHRQVAEGEERAGDRRAEAGEAQRGAGAGVGEEEEGRRAGPRQRGLLGVEGGDQRDQRPEVAAARRAVGALHDQQAKRREGQGRDRRLDAHRPDHSRREDPRRVTAASAPSAPARRSRPAQQRAARAARRTSQEARVIVRPPA